MSNEVPHFWNDEPVLWLHKLEALMFLNNIDTDTAKYYYLLTHLSKEHCVLMKNVITAATSNYYILKSELIKRLTMQNIMKVQLGDKTPSELLSVLMIMADGIVSNDEVLKIWLELLPLEVRDITKHVAEPLETVKSLADSSFQQYKMLCKTTTDLALRDKCDDEM